jgi:hypothetical protein
MEGYEHNSKCSNDTWNGSVLGWELRNPRHCCLLGATDPFLSIPCSLELSIWVYQQFSLFRSQLPRFQGEKNLCWALVAHTCNPSYSRGRDQEDCDLKPGGANSSHDPSSKKPITKKGWWNGSVLALSSRLSTAKKKKKEPLLSNKFPRRALSFLVSCGFLLYSWTWPKFCPND